jgi:radical SAM/Cys-rich protein
MSIAPEVNQLLGFETRLCGEKAALKRLSLDTVQINLGRLCNQACHHCHMEAGLDRKEIMTGKTAQSVVEFVETSGAGTVDITGGAPEMNPGFRGLIDKFVRSGKRVLVRSNLTVLLESGLQDIPEYLAERQIEIVASMPCYTEENVDAQRGPGVYQKSIAALRRLNDLGYGQEESGLVLNLVYNPGDATLPSAQDELERDYKRELTSRLGLEFNRLLTIANQPIGRFAAHLNRSGEMASYTAQLAGAFNANNLPSLMCLRQASISWDGLVYDCDFNQSLGLSLGDGRAYRIGEMQPEDLVARLIGRTIRSGNHCYACTAGSGSSCAGALS